VVTFDELEIGTVFQFSHGPTWHKKVTREQAEIIGVGRIVWPDGGELVRPKADPEPKTAITLRCSRCGENSQGYVLGPWFCHGCRVIIWDIMKQLKKLTGERA